MEHRQVRSGRARLSLGGEGHRIQSADSKVRESTMEGQLESKPNLLLVSKMEQRFPPTVVVVVILLLTFKRRGPAE